MWNSIKKIAAAICLSIGFALVMTPGADAVHVNGYYRSNGTYVNGYERTSPDSSPYNNYSYPGNYNPNTGKITGGNTSTYLENYYDSSSSSYSPSYNYSYPSTPSCPLMSIYDSLSGSCKCMSGYVTGKDLLGKESCVSALQKCQSDYGYGASYSYLSNSCECSYGYVMSDGRCISNSSFCSNKMGLMSSYNSLSKTCECMVGYEFNGLSCVYKRSNYSYSLGHNTDSVASCPINSMPLPSDSTKCRCNIGFKANTTGDGCEVVPPKTCPLSSTLVGKDCVCNIGLILKNNQCISHTEDCVLYFGNNVLGTPGSGGNSSCNCASGYQWNNTKTACQLIPEAAQLSINYQPIISDNITSSLQVGSSGTQVTTLQNILRKLGNFTGDATGYYGKVTREAVISYQKSRNILTTGTIGPKTRESLNLESR